MARARAALACVSAGVAGAASCPSGHGVDQADGHNQQPAQDHRRQRRELGFELQFFQSLLETTLQEVGTLAGFVGVELGVGSAGLFLELELLRPVIPIGNLLGQPILHRRFGLGHQFELAAAHFGQVFRHDVGDGVTLRLLLQIAG